MCSARQSPYFSGTHRHGHPDFSLNTGDNSQLEQEAHEFLQKRGTQLRQKRNRLLFFVIDHSAITRLKDNSSTYLAWQSIVDDINDEKINLDIYQKRETENNCNKENKVFVQTVREAYCFLMNAYRVDGSSDTEWEYEKIDTSKAQLLSVIDDKIISMDWVVKDWAANNLRTVLQKYYFKNDVSDVLITKIFADLASHIYFPRLESEEVLRKTIEKGVVGGEFGYARSKGGDHYDRLRIGMPTHVIIDDRALLVQADVTHQQKSPPVQQQPTLASTQAAQTSSQHAQKKRFHASVVVQPTIAKMELNRITDEILSHLPRRLLSKIIEL